MSNFNPFKKDSSYYFLYEALRLSARELDIYDYLEETPKVTLIVNLIDELRNLGYEIKPIKT